MKTAIVLISCLLLLSSCHSSNSSDKSGTDEVSRKDTSQGTISKFPPFQLAGKSYTFGPDLDTNACRVISACDCCESQVLFIDDHHFIAISFCLWNDNYAHGTYHVSGDKVYLKYEGKAVDKITDAKVESDTTVTHSDTLKTTIRYALDSVQNNIDTLKAFMCKGIVGLNAFFVEPTHKDYGLPDGPNEINTKLENLKMDSILERMEFKWNE